MAEKTVTIIGAGLAGLAAGTSLARRGMRVRVLEANDTVGGCSATTVVDGYTFHDGALFLSMPGLLDAAFERLGLDREREVPVKRMDAPYTGYLPDGSSMSVQEGRAWLQQAGRVSLTPLDPEVDRLVARWRPMYRLLIDDLMRRPFSMSRMLVHGWRQLPKLRGTVGAELRRAFREEAVQAAMGGVVLYAGVAPDSLSVMSTLGIVALLDEGFFAPVGGMGRIPDALARGLVAAGGEIVTGATVERVVVDRGRAVGVHVARGDLIPSDVVLSTVSAMATFGRLVAPEHVPGSLLRKVEKAPLSHRAVGIGLGLSDRIDGVSHINSVLPWLSEQGRVFADGEADRWLTWIVPTATDPTLAPDGGSIVEMFCPVAPGAATPDAAAVQRMADAAIASLSRRHRLDVAVRRVRGPEQFRTEMHLLDGALYGLSPAVSPIALFPQRTPIRGLYQAGQTTYPGYGVAGATMSGVLAAERIASEA